MNTSSKVQTLELITGVAITFDNGCMVALPRPYRHGDLFKVMGQLNIDYVEHEMGFITHTGRFVDRKTAYELTIFSGQFNRRPYDGCKLEELFSEDVW